MGWKLLRISTPGIFIRNPRTGSSLGTGGYTAVELIIVAGLLSLLIGAIFTPLVTGQFYWHRGESDVQVQRKARSALERVIRDIRHAGFRSEGFDYINKARADEISFEADLDDDGTAETVHFFKDGDSLKKGVQLVGELSETVSLVADNVSAFSLTYYENSDPPIKITLDADGNVSSSDLNGIALVEARITTSITRSGYTKEITLNSEALIRR